MRVSRPHRFPWWPVARGSPAVWAEAGDAAAAAAGRVSPVPPRAPALLPLLGAAWQAQRTEPPCVYGYPRRVFRVVTTQQAAPRVGGT